MSRADWNQLLYHEVVESMLPRCWLRSAVRFAQIGTTVTPGNPVDEQHAAHLPDVDVFLTGDAKYQRLLEGLHGCAPVPIARPLLVPGGADDLIEAIERLLRGQAEKP
ncbi:MAG: hypothetical protein WD757_03165 [Actinomycetota bacterium]